MPLPTRLSRLADALMEACWLAGLAVTPLFFNVYSSRIFEPDKTALFRSLSLLLAAAWAIKLLDQRRLTASGSAVSASGRLRTFLSLPLVGPAAGLALITGLGVALSL